MKNTDLSYQFSRLNIAEKLIVINVLVFVVSGIIRVFFGFDLDQWFLIPKDFIDFLFQPWSLVTYSFFHGGIWHLLFNMLLLYYAGRIFLNLLDGRRFLNVYLLGIILGAFIFLLSYNVFPELVRARTLGLIGASAGVMSVFIFVCTYLPNQEVRVFFFNLKLWILGAILVAKDLLYTASGYNVGGGLAHLGGALMGYIYAKRLLEGKDIGAGFSKILDVISLWFKPKNNQPPFKTVYKNSRTSNNNHNLYQKASNQKKIDAILDKISKSGYESLTKEEKDFLFNSGKEE